MQKRFYHLLYVQNNNDPEWIMTATNIAKQRLRDFFNYMSQAEERLIKAGKFVRKEEKICHVNTYYTFYIKG